MADLNKVFLQGRLGRDPEIRATQSGEKIANFSVATGERWKDKNTGEQKERTEWHNIVVFGPLAATVEKYLRKGARCIIEGVLRTRKWQDQNGNDRWSTEVVITAFSGSVNIIDWPDSDGGRSQGQEDAYGNMPGTSGRTGSRDDGASGGQRGDYGGGRSESGGSYGGGGGRSDMDDEIPF